MPSHLASRRGGLQVVVFNAFNIINNKSLVLSAVSGFGCGSFSVTFMISYEVFTPGKTLCEKSQITKCWYFLSVHCVAFCPSLPSEQGDIWTDFQYYQQKY